MWKRLIILFWAILLLPATPMLAAAIDIGITAQGIASAGIFNFTITYVTDTQMNLSWTLGANVSNVMIRSKYGAYPADILNVNQAPSDGNLVYYGSSTSFNDTAMNFDENPGGLYYRAWAQLPDGTWVITPAQGWKESAVVTFLGMLAIAGIFSFLGARNSYYILKFLAGAAWVIVGLYWQSSPPSVIVAGSPVHVSIMILFWVFGIAFMFYPFWRTNGEGLGKVTPFWRSQEDDDEITRARNLPTRSERNSAYAARLNNALNNRR